MKVNKKQLIPIRILSIYFFFYLILASTVSMGSGYRQLRSGTYPNSSIYQPLYNTLTPLSIPILIIGGIWIWALRDEKKHL